jgi:DNA-binding response OmpR family regulator
MPDPDGFKFCRQSKSESGFEINPIIIVTSLDDSDSRHVAFGAGANDYLTKPFSIHGLTKRVGLLILE